MKTTIRVPTDQFAFVEVEFTEQMTVEEIAESYQNLKKAFVVGEGLEPKEFNRVIDFYIMEGTMQAHEYEAMDSAQQNVVQCIKRSINRTKR